MSGKPFKMKGSPFQRNFGIGRTESPDAVTPAKGLMEGLGNLDLRGAAQAALSQLPGGKIQGGGSTEYEKNEDGSLKLDKDGNPIPKESESESESKAYKVKDLIGDVNRGISKIKNFGKTDDETDDSSATSMKGSPAKHP